MPIQSFRWPRSLDGVTRLSFVVAGAGFFELPMIIEAMHRWQLVASVEFHQAAAFNDTPGDPRYTQIVIAPLDEVKKIVPGYDTAIGLAAVITAPDGSPRRGYVGLEQRGDGNDLWVATHEVGHLLGFRDDYPAPNTTTIYSRTPGTGYPQAGDIEQVQAVFGASPRDDEIVGGDGSGPISGGDGRDTIYGNKGADILYGNRQADTLYGGQGLDVLYGGQGADLLYGNRDGDTIYGNLGDDTLYGGQGDDWMHGGQGDDVLVPGRGNDTVYGGAGTDIAVYRGLGIALVGNVVTGPGFRHELHGVEIVEINGVRHRIQSG